MNNGRRYHNQTTDLRAYRLDELPRGMLGKPISAPSNGTCRYCSHEFPIPWDRKCSREPVMEARPNDDPNLEHVAGISFSCPQCKNPHLIFIRGQRRGIRVELYGDESHFEWGGGHKFFTYVFVLADDFAKPELEQALIEAKRALRPESDPAAWVLHMRKIRSFDWRRRNAIGCSTETVNAEAAAIARKIASLQGHVLPFIAMSNFKRGSFEEIRDNTISTAIHIATENVTEAGLDCAFFLEATNKPAGNYSDAHIERLARGLFCNPGFIWDTRACIVELPITTPKIQRAELEIADFIAFWTNRFVTRRIMGKHTELPLEAFGAARWSLDIQEGWSSIMTTGMPEKFRIQAPE